MRMRQWSPRRWMAWGALFLVGALAIGPGGVWESAWGLLLWILLIVLGSLCLVVGFIVWLWRWVGVAVERREARNRAYIESLVDRIVDSNKEGKA